MNLSAPASCLSEPAGCFCELHPVGSVMQPSNALSAASFLVVAALVLIREPKRRLAWAYSAALVIVALGTAYYHAHMTFLGQTFDFGGMDLVILMAPFYYLAHGRSKGYRVTAWAGYGIVLLALIAELLWLPGIRRPVFAVFVAWVLWLYLGDPRRIVLKESKLWIWWGLAVFAVGFLFWNLDIYALFCVPRSWLQGHAIWHVASAVAAYCLYRAMRLGRR